MAWPDQRVMITGVVNHLLSGMPPSKRLAYMTPMPQFDISTYIIISTKKQFIGVMFTNLAILFLGQYLASLSFFH